MYVNVDQARIAAYTVYAAVQVIYMILLVLLGGREHWSRSLLFAVLRRCDSIPVLKCETQFALYLSFYSIVLFGAGRAQVPIVRPSTA